MRPYATLLTPAHPYPLMVAPSRPRLPISLSILPSKAVKHQHDSRSQNERTFGSVRVQYSWKQLLLTIFLCCIPGSRQTPPHNRSKSFVTERQLPLLRAMILGSMGPTRVRNAILTLMFPPRDYMSRILQPVSMRLHLWKLDVLDELAIAL